MCIRDRSWSATLSGGYVQQGVALNMDNYNLWWNNVNISKKFLKDLLTVGAYVQNPFTPVMRLNIHGHGPGNNVTTIVSRSNFSVGINLTYNLSLIHIYFLKNILTDISATRTGIGGEFLLIKRLCEGESLICGEAVTYISLLLQSGQVIPEGWSCMRHLSCDLCDRKRADTA